MPFFLKTWLKLKKKRKNKQSKILITNFTDVTTHVSNSEILLAEDYNSTVTEHPENYDASEGTGDNDQQSSTHDLNINNNNTVVNNSSSINDTDMDENVENNDENLPADPENSDVNECNLSNFSNDNGVVSRGREYYLRVLERGMSGFKLSDENSSAESDNALAPSPNECDENLRTSPDIPEIADLINNITVNCDVFQKMKEIKDMRTLCRSNDYLKAEPFDSEVQEQERDLESNEISLKHPDTVSSDEGLGILTNPGETNESDNVGQTFIIPREHRPYERMGIKENAIDVEDYKEESGKSSGDNWNEAKKEEIQTFINVNEINNTTSDSSVENAMEDTEISPTQPPAKPYISCSMENKLMAGDASSTQERDLNVHISSEKYQNDSYDLKRVSEEEYKERPESTEHDISCDFNLSQILKMAFMIGAETLGATNGENDLNITDDSVLNMYNSFTETEKEKIKNLFENESNSDKCLRDRELPFDSKSQEVGVIEDDKGIENIGNSDYKTSYNDNICNTSLQNIIREDSDATDAHENTSVINDFDNISIVDNLVRNKITSDENMINIISDESISKNISEENMYKNISEENMSKNISDENISKNISEENMSKNISDENRLVTESEESCKVELQSSAYNAGDTLTAECVQPMTNFNKNGIQISPSATFEVNHDYYTNSKLVGTDIFGNNSMTEFDCNSLYSTMMKSEIESMNEEIENFRGEEECEKSIFWSSNTNTNIETSTEKYAEDDQNCSNVQSIIKSKSDSDLSMGTHCCKYVHSNTPAFFNSPNYNYGKGQNCEDFNFKISDIENEQEEYSIKQICGDTVLGFVPKNDDDTEVFNVSSYFCANNSKSDTNKNTKILNPFNDEYFMLENSKNAERKGHMKISSSAEDTHDESFLHKSPKLSASESSLSSRYSENGGTKETEILNDRRLISACNDRNMNRVPDNPRMALYKCKNRKSFDKGIEQLTPHCDIKHKMQKVRKIKFTMNTTQKSEFLPQKCTGPTIVGDCFSGKKPKELNAATCSHSCGEKYPVSNSVPSTGVEKKYLLQDDQDESLSPFQERNNLSRHAHMINSRENETQKVVSASTFKTAKLDAISLVVPTSSTIPLVKNSFRFQESTEPEFKPDGKFNSSQGTVKTQIRRQRIGDFEESSEFPFQETTDDESMSVIAEANNSFCESGDLKHKSTQRQNIGETDPCTLSSDTEMETSETSLNMTPIRKMILDKSRSIRSPKYSLRHHRDRSRSFSRYKRKPCYYTFPEDGYVAYLTKNDNDSIYRIKKGLPLFEERRRKYKYIGQDDQCCRSPDFIRHDIARSAGNRGVSPDDLQAKFDDRFKRYARRGRNNGDLISYKRSTEWLKDAGVVGKVLTATEANDAFKGTAGMKVALNKGDYRHFLMKLTRIKRLNYNDIYERLCSVSNKFIH